MIKDLNHHYHLLVKGLLSDLDIAGQFHSLIADLSLARGSRVRRVGLLDHIITARNNDTELSLKLSFGGGESDFDEEVARSFCAAVVHPDSDGILLGISRYGLLGFSPIEGTDFSEFWNMTVLGAMYLDGYSTFERSQRRALLPLVADMAPEWFRLVTFVAGSPLEKYFGINPAFRNMGAGVIKATQDRLSQPPDTGNWFWGQPENLGPKLLKLWSQKNPATQTSNSLEVMMLFSDSIREVTRLLRLAYDDKELTSQRHRQIFKCLYKLTLRACSAFTSNTETILIYEKHIASHAVSAGIGAINAGFGGFETYRHFAERALVKPEGWLTRAGRAVGLVNTATPEVVKKGLLVKGALSAAGTLWSAWEAGSSIYRIIESKERRDSCAEAAYLISQTWFTAAETITFLRWIHCTNGQFHFVGHCGEMWEERLKLKLGEIEEDWKSPEAVRLYLNSQHDALIEKSEELRIKLMKAYSEPL